ncbi:MAG: hypothetical protein V9E87_06060 [Gemmatimonadales bacterium]
MAKIAWFDDEPYWVEKLRRRLVRDGHTLSTFSTVAEALAGLDEIRSADIVVVDLIALGERSQNSYELYGGLEIMHKLNEGGRVPPTLAFSVVGSEAVLREVRLYATRILEKPASADTLSETILEMLAKAREITNRQGQD